MVSLSSDSRHSGGRFFEHEQSIQFNDTEELLSDQVSLGAEFDPPFRTIRTTWAIVLQILFIIGLAVLAFVIPIICGESQCSVSPYATILYCHASLWFLLMALDRYFRYEHYTSRIRGYLEFYRKTRNIRRFPLMISSAGNASLVIGLVLIDQYCSKLHNNKCGSLTSINVLQIFISIEMALMLFISAVFFAQTCKFNHRHASPDIQQEDLMTSFLQSRVNSTEIGFKDDNYMDRVLEKQADMIRYLKQHNAYLAKKILTLSTELKNEKNKS